MKKPYRFWKRRKVWYYRLADDMTWHTTNHTNKNRAEQYAAKVLREGRPAVTRATLQKFVDERHIFVIDECSWSKWHKVSDAVTKGRRSQLDRYVLPRWGAAPMGEITALDIRDWLESLPLAQQTRKHLRTLLGIILDEAKRARRITTNPVGEMDIMPDESKPRDTFEPAEIMALFPKDPAELEKLWAGPQDKPSRWQQVGSAAADPRGLYWASFYMLMFTSGMRMGEIRALLWHAVLPDPGGVLVQQAVKTGGAIGPPKAQEIRAVALPSRTLVTLERWRAVTPNPAPEEFVFFGHRHGEPVTGHTAGGYFKHALAAAKIDQKGRTLTPHSLRHYYNSALRRRVPEEVLREFTGHRSEKMTQRYDHPEVREILVQRLEHHASLRPALELAFEAEVSTNET